MTSSLLSALAIVAGAWLVISILVGVITARVFVLTGRGELPSRRLRAERPAARRLARRVRA